MTPRQRWRATLAGEPRDRIATDIWATSEMSAKLRDHLGVASNEAVWDTLSIDTVRSVGARYVGPPLPADTSVWGVKYKQVSYGAGEYSETAESPLAGAQTVAEIEAYPWPRPEWYDVSHIPSHLAEMGDDLIVRGGAYEPFLLYCSMRGMEQAYMDLIADPEIAEAALTHIFAFHEEVNRRLLEAGGGRIDLFYLAEDLGGQHGPLFSLKAYERFLMPNQARMAQLARDHGAAVFYHSDGVMRSFLPHLIERVGIDILNPLQWRCPGMELPELVRDFGRDVVFHGGIDNQHTLPFGTPDEVRDQVTWVAGVMSEARWVCAPCHNIQPNTPPQNVVAMYEAAHALAVGA